MSGSISLSIFNGIIPIDYDFHLPDDPQTSMIEQVISSVKKQEEKILTVNNTLMSNFNEMHLFELKRRQEMVHNMYNNNEKLKKILIELEKKAADGICRIEELYYKFLNFKSQVSEEPAEKRQKKAPHRFIEDC